MFDVEKAIIDTLKPYWSVYSNVPAQTKQNDTFITVERTSGGAENGVGDVTCAVQCWSDTRANASDLALSVSDKLPELLNNISICNVKIDGLYNFPDLSGNHARYQIVVRLKTTEGVVI